MKRWLSILVAIALMTSMTTLCMAEAAWESVPSKTTTNTSQVARVQSATGEALPVTFVIMITEDAEPVVHEITKLYIFVHHTEESRHLAPIEYFPEEIQRQVAQRLVKQGLPEDYDLKLLELDEFVTLQEFGYEEQYGDVLAELQFVTEYQQGQRLVGVLGFYTGEVDEEGNDVVEWVTVEAQALEGGMVAVKLTREQLLRFHEVKAIALAILSEPMP